jgi:tetratricopeptide (TPR) repeat protein
MLLTITCSIHSFAGDNPPVFIQFKGSAEQKVDSVIDILRGKLATNAQEALAIGHSIELYFNSHSQYVDKFCIVYNDIAVGYYIIGNYEKAIYYSLKALKFAGESENTSQEAIAYNSLGLIYVRMDMLDKGLYYFNKAIDIFKVLEDVYSLARLYTNIGSVYYLKNDWEKSINSLEKGLDYYTAIGKDTAGIVGTMLTLAAVHSYSGDTSISNEYLTKSESKLLGSSDYKSRIDLLITKCEIGTRWKKYDVVLKSAEEIIALSSPKGMKDQLMNGYMYKWQALEHMGNIPGAFKAYKEYVAMKDSLLDSEKLSEINKIQTNYEIEIRENKIFLLQKDKELLFQKGEAEKRKRLIWVILSILVVAISVFVYYILNNRLIKMRLEQQLLQEKINNSNKDLTNSALLIFQKNNLISLVKTELKIVRKAKNTEESHRQINILINKLNIETGVEKDRVTFYNHLDEKNRDFFYELDKKYPNLTSNEKKLAALIRLKYTSKEIAGVLGISHNSVNVNRYRLRKKMRLESEDDLEKLFGDI